MGHIRYKSRLLLIVTAVLLLAASCGKKTAVADYSIIPEPAFTTLKGRTFTLSSSTHLCFENLGQNTPTAKYISQSLRKMHVRPAFISKPERDCITFSIYDTVNPAIGDEGYVIQVRPDGIFVGANSEAGLFYAYQTFVQMLPDDIASTHYKHITLQECTIMDYPRFSWRGSHLDCCRHFFTLNQIKKHLDLMAAYKLNRFHWHLADDQGWRVEIEAYPQLTDIGAWRVDRTRQAWGEADPPQPGEEPTYGGYYSHDEIAEIVDYAARLHIEVIPEIDLPNHCSAILAACPEYSCDGSSRAVQNGPCWPSKALLCAGNSQSMEFVYTILDELTRLFPSEYIHIGGDEACTEQWEDCPRCQALMRQLGLADEHQLQGWMISQIQEYLSRKGKRLIGRDEMMDCGEVSDDAVIQAWRSADKAVLAARRGHPVISSISDYCNLDCLQADSQYHPTAFNEYLPLSQVYQFEPLPAGLVETEQSYVWGGEAVLWSDYTITYSDAEYMLLPRLCALAECFWSLSDNRDWTRFQQKIESHKQRLRQNGYRCCDGSFKPTVIKQPADAGLVVTISCEVFGSYIYYTTDGSAPTPESAVYTKPLRLAPGTLLRTRTLYHGEMQEGVYDFRL